MCHRDSRIPLGNKKRFCLDPELGSALQSCGLSSPRLRQLHTGQLTHVVSLADLGTSEIVHLKEVGISLEMTSGRGEQLHFINNFLNQK